MAMAIRIAFFQLCFFGVMAWVVSTGIFSSAVTNGINMDATSSDLKNSLPDISAYSSNTIPTFIFGDFYRMAKTLLKLVFFTLFPISLFNEMGIHNGIIDLLAMMCTVIYVVGVVEYVANRKLEPQ